MKSFSQRVIEVWADWPWREGQCFGPKTPIALAIKLRYTTDMDAIDITEIKRDVDGFLDRVRHGESLIITGAGVPVAEVAPVRSKRRERRPFGLCSGEFTVPDDFDAALPDSVVSAFDGE